MISNENGTNGFYMPVAPAYGGGDGFGGFGNDWGWIILLLLFAGGGWGNGFGGYGGGYANMTDFPWLLNGQSAINANTNAGFQNLMLNDSVTSIRDGISGLSTQLCGSTADVTAAVTNGFANSEIAANARQIADMQTAFANQTAMASGFSGIQSQLAQCCCDNRLATAQTQALVQSENCADRQVLSDGIRDIISNQTSGVQRILDQMSSDKIDAKNEKIADLERQLTMANLASSQAEQTSKLIADNNAQTQYVVNRVAPYPIPAYQVANPYGYASTCGCVA